MLLKKLPTAPAIPKLLINKIIDIASTAQSITSFLNDAAGLLLLSDVDEERFFAISFLRF